MPTTPLCRTLDANEAVADVAYRVSDLAVIYPITPSSPMAESMDEWATQGRMNLWGHVPGVEQMQSEGGAAGALHGALQAGAMTTTFTASQGLLLMVPNLYKIAGELLPCVVHVAARTIATHALSIFGDHSDVMACRQTGWAMLCAASVQEAHDFAAIAHAATLRTRIPVMHFFDGFRTSHEVARIHLLDDDTLRGLLDPAAIERFRSRALSPAHPELRGTAQNPDVFFQAREAANGFYLATPDAVQAIMDELAAHTGRPYRLFDYHGAPDATRVIVVMGSAGETVKATVDRLNAAGERVGVLQVRLYRPFDVTRFHAALPPTVQRIAVLDRTKEPGAVGEPLYLDVHAALGRAYAGRPAPHLVVVGGRYGLSSKEFTPAMARAVFDHLATERPRHGFTIGILDDVTHTSLPWDPDWVLEPRGLRAVFYGLGADGTVGANKNTIKIIGEDTDNFAQGYFVYDSKKSGAQTTSHLRFGPEKFEAPYLIGRGTADFVGCHQFVFTTRMDVLALARPGAVFLLNAPYAPDRVWDQLPVELQRTMIQKQVKFYVIDAVSLARQVGMPGRINTVMQTCFFAISGVLPRDEAVARIKKTIEKTYGKKGAHIVEMNFKAIDETLSNLHEVPLPTRATGPLARLPVVAADAPDLVQRLTAPILAGHGDLLPVSALPVDGSWPTHTSRFEKRGIADEVPRWEKELCIQCNQCAIICPHAAIRTAAYPPQDRPTVEGWQGVPYKAPDLRGMEYVVQVAPDDCTGCHLCVMVCPAKDKAEPKRKAINMAPRTEQLELERRRFDAFLKLPPLPRERIVRLDAKGSQFLEPLFEFSGACAGCGETPYLKLLTQLFGDRLLIANATGCSSIYGGNLPTTPYAKNAAGRGPAWCNSLFEDNAEFGYGFRLGYDARPDGPEDPCVWIVGGDGWAYDIGFGGLDHVIAQPRNVNLLVLDTQVYSNTGGQASKATPLGASAKFASGGKRVHQKDLGLVAMSYGHVYVAQVAIGADPNQTVQALLEAQSYDGPSLVIAYSHCIAHGYDLRNGASQQKLAVASGVWPLYRFDPRKAQRGEPPMTLDARPGDKVRASAYMANETRFRMVQKIDPKRFERLAQQADREAANRVDLYRQLAALRTVTHPEGETS